MKTLEWWQGSVPPRCHTILDVKSGLIKAAICNPLQIELKTINAPLTKEGKEITSVKVRLFQNDTIPIILEKVIANWPGIISRNMIRPSIDQIDLFHDGNLISKLSQSTTKSLDFFNNSHEFRIKVTSPLLKVSQSETNINTVHTNNTNNVNEINNIDMNNNHPIRHHSLPEDVFSQYLPLPSKFDELSGILNFRLEKMDKIRKHVLQLKQQMENDLKLVINAEEIVDWEKKFLVDQTLSAIDILSTSYQDLSIR